tara:strand:- start:62244 stop:63191 length:948 start_codon:yes stop_codon:yes gene_type:complete
MVDKREEINQKIAQLEQLLAETTEQPLTDYLDGLLHTKPINYWDYIQLETLLNLQKPKTNIQDETIFITYHQICELMFLLIIQECHALCFNSSGALSVWQKHLSRIIRYYKHLISSFDIMTEGLDKTEFLQFRVALFPSSGFQSFQYRKIELYSSSLHQLIHAQNRNAISPTAPLVEQYDELYWKFGNRDFKTGKKTLTLKQFEAEYDDDLLRLAEQLETKNIRAKYLGLSQKEQENPELIKLLKAYDQQANLFWPLVHMGAAKKFLAKSPEDLAATGGTNWQDYLPPSHQKIMFFPEVWGMEEKHKWDKSAKHS